MAGNSRSLEQVRREIEDERNQLTGAVDSLRSGIGEATNVGAKKLSYGVLGKGLPQVSVFSFAFSPANPDT